ncbi:MAG TPA: DUF4410 domain-containing protein [Pseudomonas sp.]|nr:DUF4410 domain-containing protein [Pseudomonas sp.]
MPINSVFNFLCSPHQLGFSTLHTKPRRWAGLLLLAVGLGVSAYAVSETPRLRGGVEIRGEALETAKPMDALPHVYIADFVLDAATAQAPSKAPGALPEQQQSGRVGVLGRLSQRLPHPLAAGNPQETARDIVERMSAELIESFVERGLQAQRISPSETLPRDGWLIQGVFTEVDEGNRIRRAMIGFGSGASSMNAQVTVSHLAGQAPLQPFLVLTTEKDPSKLPGAILTKNPYVAAAKFVVEKNASQRDIKMTAEKIVDEILKYQPRVEDGGQAAGPGH